MWRVFIYTIVLCVSQSGQAVELDWLAQTRFFAYTPSEFHFKQDRPVFAGRDSIAKDLQLLRRYADGLILYSTDKSTADVLTQAKTLRYSAIILGVWSVTDSDEINRVISLAHQYPKLVRAIAVGNEGLFWQRYTRAELTQAMNTLRNALPNIALATTEPFASYLGTPARIDCSNQDFLLPTIHPVFEDWFTPTESTQAVEFVVNVVNRLSELCHKYVLIKETGIPSGPLQQSYSEQQQLLFWQQLLRELKGKPGVSTALFEAFDAPWKVTEIKKQTGEHDERERYWGWFKQDRRPKAVVRVLEGH